MSGEIVPMHDKNARLRINRLLETSRPQGTEPVACWKPFVCREPRQSPAGNRSTAGSRTSRLLETGRPQGAEPVACWKPFVCREPRQSPAGNRSALQCPEMARFEFTS